MTKIILNRSRDNMAKTLHKLKIRLKKTPEDETGLREVLIRKIELLKIIRGEMKTLIRQLE